VSITAVLASVSPQAFSEYARIRAVVGALLDRLTHRIHVLEANGESCRLRESRQRLKRQAPKQS
jgi:hypothetical protein